MSDDGWITWNGGEWDKEPISGLIEVRFRGGGTDRDFAEIYYWAHDGDGSDIVAYRFAEGAER